MPSSRENDKARYENRIANGLCVNCGKPKDRHDRRLCFTCRQQSILRTTKLHAARKSKGLCVICGNSSRENRALCVNCAGLKRKRRQRCVMMLGGKCECCGESKMEFLAIDHIQGGGSRHRKETNDPSGAKLVSRLLNGKEDKSKYRVLCHNCNLSLGFYGYCPHTNK